MNLSRSNLVHRLVFTKEIQEDYTGRVSKLRWRLALILLGLPGVFILFYIFRSVAWLQVWYPRPNVPPEVEQVLRGESFYFTSGGTIFSTNGVQRRPMTVKEYTCSRQNGFAVAHFLPAQSPDKTHLAFYRVSGQTFECLTWPLETHRIQVIAMDVRTRAERVLFEVQGNQSLPWFLTEAPFHRFVSCGEVYTRCRDLLPSYAVGWSRDSRHVLFNFPDLTRTALNDRNAEIPYVSYDVDLRTGIRSTMPEKQEIAVTRTDTCFGGLDRVVDPTTGKFVYDICFTDSSGRFEFRKSKQEGSLCEQFVTGYDHERRQSFRLTTYRRQLYCK